MPLPGVRRHSNKAEIANSPDLCAAGKTGAALTVDAARLRAMAAVQPMRQSEPLPLEAALGRVLSESPTAKSNLPPFDNSAMDGYAIRRSDLSGPGPFQLRVTDRIAAGDRRLICLYPCTAAQIFTGGPLPEGADAVIMQERVRRSKNIITFDELPHAGQNIRRSGEDRRRGDPTLQHGLLLTPTRLALLAGTGVEEVVVCRKLMVGLFSTGNELCELGTELEPGQIYNSNRVMLRAMLAEPWVHVTDYGILPDHPGRIRSTIRQAATQNDVVVSSGGVSAGEEDHILDALSRENAALEVLKVAIRPGKPLTIGRVGNALFFGLPGNPYAAAITFSQIARPALRKAAGITESSDFWIPAVSGFEYIRSSGRREFVPVTWDSRDVLGRPVLQSLGKGASASLGPIAIAHGIAVIEPDVTHIVPGMPIAVEPLI